MNFTARNLITACFLVPAISKFLRRLHGESEREEYKPQSRFKRILADNSDTPFCHVNGTSGRDARHPYSESLQRLNESPFAIYDVLHRFEVAPKHLGFTWVDTVAALREAAEMLADVTAVAVDVEHNHTRSYRGTVCLVQLSDGATDWLIDALALHDYLHILAPLFHNASILKVMHGAESDVTWLQRDFHIYCVNVFDTARASQEIAGGNPRSLASLLQQMCGIQSDKSWQLSDWRVRPLPQPALDYAATDVHYLLHIAALLACQLQGLPPSTAGAVNWSSLQSEADALKGNMCSSCRGSNDDNESNSTHLPQAVAESSQYSEADAPKGINSRLNKDSALGSDTASLQLLRAMAKSHRITARLYSNSQHEAAALVAAQAVVRRCSSAARRCYPPGRIASEDEDYQQPSIVGCQPGVSDSEQADNLQAGIAPGQSDTLSDSALIGSARRDCVYGLCLWRDAIARRLDEGLQYVMSDALLWDMALQRPHDSPAVARLASEAPASSAGRMPLTSDAIKQVLHALRCAEQGRIRWPSDKQRASHPGGDSKHGSQKPSPAAAEKLRLNQLPPEERQRILRERMVRKFAAKEPVYDNCRMLAKGGELLCYCDRQKVDWYLERGLADVEPNELGGPIVIRLRFEHQNNDQRADMQHFYVERKANRCVGCGDSSHYLRYRVIPACYRRHFPEALKSHRSHDIVLLCLKCHQLAHTEADRTKLQVVRDFGVPLLPPDDVASSTIEGEPLGRNESQVAKQSEGGGTGGETRPNAATIRRAAGALLKHRNSMPTERRRKVEAVVAAYVGVPTPTLDHLSDDAITAGIQAGLPRKSRLKALRRLPPEMAAAAAAASHDGPGKVEHDVEFGAAGHLWHGRQVVAEALRRGGTAELGALGRRFRNSFMQAVQPQYLSTAWDVGHNAERNFGAHSIFAADQGQEAAPVQPYLCAQQASL